MTVERHSDPEKHEVTTDPEKVALLEAENGVRQFEEIIKFFHEARVIYDQGGKWKLRPKHLLTLQYAALSGISVFAGTYRNSAMKIHGSKHAPPDAFDIPEKIQEMCNHINENWDTRTAIYLSAYAMWRLNWIHPFTDGNGRTARAVSYLIMLIKLNTLLPGTQTIPEQIAADKGPYYDALEAADSTTDIDNPDVSKLEQLLESMLINQLMLRPNLPSSSKKRLQTVFSNRIGNVSPTLLETIYNSSSLKQQLWTVGSNIVLQLSSGKSIEEANDRFRKYGNPFPFLLGEESAKIEINSTNSGIILLNKTASLTNEYLIRLDRDCYATIVGPHVTWSNLGDALTWFCDGALYILKLGDLITDSNLDETFDLMIAKHLEMSRNGQS